VDLLALALIRSHPRLRLVETALNTYDMLNKKSKVNKKTLLHYCALFGAPNAVELLLDRELLKVNEEDSDRNTPLHLCFTVEGFMDQEIENELIAKAAPNARHMMIMDRLQVAKILLQRVFLSLLFPSNAHRPKTLISTSSPKTNTVSKPTTTP
jgi:ankyrin repeat protein